MLLEPDRSDLVVMVGTRVDDPIHPRRLTDRASVVYVDHFAPERVFWPSDRKPVAVLSVDTSRNFERIRSALEGLIGPEVVKAVVCQDENALPLADYLRLRLVPDAVDQSPQTTLLKDKAAMRRHLAGKGFGEVAYATGTTEADILGFFHRHGCCVVKLRDGVGSASVTRVDAPERAVEAYESIRAVSAGRPFLIEEYLDGPEYSVEAMTLYGRHGVLAVTQKVVDSNFVEVAHLVPAPLPEDERLEIEDFVFRFLTSVGIVEGPSHTEVRATSGGLRIIESHNRVGGDKIASLVEIVYGANPFDLYFDAALRRAVELPASWPVGAAAVAFFEPRVGRLLRLEGYDRLRGLDGVEAIRWRSDGRSLPSTISSRSRAGCVIVRGTEPAAVLRRAIEFASSVRVVCEGD